MTKIEEKYGEFGLVKDGDVTTYKGKMTSDYPQIAQYWLANYGMFVAFSRTWATSKDCPLTDAEKRAKLDKMHNWLMEGCPKRERTVTSAKDLAIAKMRDAVKDASDAEKAMIEAIIAKM